MGEGKAGAGPAESRPARLEAMVRAQYEWCRPGDTFDDLRRRARFEKDSKGLLKHWLEVVGRRAAMLDEADREPAAGPQSDPLVAPREVTCPAPIQGKAA